MFVNTHSLLLCFHPKPSCCVSTLSFCTYFLQWHVFFMPFCCHAFFHHFYIAYTFKITFFNYKECTLQKNCNDMGIIINARLHKKGHSRKLSNKRELLICALEVNSP